MANFEVFRSKGVRRPRPPTVTITRRKIIIFSESAYAALGRPGAVIYLTDRGAPAIGFRPASPGDEDAYMVRAGRSMQGGLICRQLGIDISQSRRYPLLEQDGVHYIDLRQPGKVVTSNRARQPAAG